jgi:hypothetical protein
MKQYYVVSIDSKDANQGLEPEDLYDAIVRLVPNPDSHIRSIGVREVSHWPTAVRLLLKMSRLASEKAIEPQVIRTKR